MQQNVINVTMARNLIKEKTVVQTVSLTKTWYQQHFTSYLGINKEVILLENYEASLPWFPFKWNNKMLNEFLKKKAVFNFPVPDYIFIYGKYEKESVPLNDTIKDYISLNMVKIYESPNKFCCLYRQKNK